MKNQKTEAKQEKQVRRLELHTRCMAIFQCCFHGVINQMFGIQEFLKVFEELRDELLEDEILKGQPEESREWLEKVRLFENVLLT